MSSESEHTTRNSGDGGSEIEASPTDAETAEKSSGQTRPPTVENENNSNNTISGPQLHEVSSVRSNDKTGASAIPDMKGETKKTETQLPEGAEDNMPEQMDTGSEVLNQPATVELPPLEQTQLPLDQDVEEKTPSNKAEKDTKSPPLDLAASNVVELPPLDQACASTSGAAADDTSNLSVYYIKWIVYKDVKVPIITQNENGPCPLLAIMNVLLLRGKVKLAPMIEMITSEQLMTYLGESILDSMPENLSDAGRANYEQNMQDAMSVMHKLQTGLDVNVRFTGVADFEYTPECIIFDLLSIPLYHGWLVDPQDPVSTSAVSMCSYNQLVEKIIAQKASEKEEVMTEALVAEQFLERTASQLTYYGLCELSTSVKEGELCVFFRNNHFTTLHRVNNELFLLVTDQGFLTESNVVWETLSNVEGDCHFVDAQFRTYTKPEPTGTISTSPVAVGSEQQIDQDYQVALSLQQEGEMRGEPDTSWGQFVQESSAINMGDHELARRLQEEEDRRAAAAVNASQQRAAAQQGQGHAQGHAHGGQGHPSQAHSSSSRQGRERQREEKKDKDCIIL